MLTLVLSLALAQPNPGDTPYANPRVTRPEAEQQLQAMRDRWPRLTPPVAIMIGGGALGIGSFGYAALGTLFRIFFQCSYSFSGSTCQPGAFRADPAWLYVAGAGAAILVVGVAYLAGAFLWRLRDRHEYFALKEAIDAPQPEPALPTWVRDVAAGALACPAAEIGFDRAEDGGLTADGCGRKATCNESAGVCAVQPE